MQGAQVAFGDGERDPQPEQQEEGQHGHMEIDDEARGDETDGAHNRPCDGAEDAVEKILFAILAG